MHIVKTSYQGGMAFSADINGHMVRMDTADDGGADSGPSPKRLMLASLAGCTGIDIVSILNKMKVSFSDLQIDVEAGLTEGHARMYRDVKVTYTVRLDEADRPKMQKAVALSQDKYCGVSAMFRSFAKVEWQIVYL